MTENQYYNAPYIEKDELNVLPITPLTLNGWEFDFDPGDAVFVFVTASTGHRAIATWKSNTVYNSRVWVQPTVPNGHYYDIFDFSPYNAAKSGDIEPVWPTDGGQVAGDGIITWEDLGAIPDPLPDGEDATIGTMVDGIEGQWLVLINITNVSSSGFQIPIHSSLSNTYCLVFADGRWRQFA